MRLTKEYTEGALDRVTYENAVRPGDSARARDRAQAGQDPQRPLGQAVPVVPPIPNGTTGTTALAEVQRAEQGVFSGKWRLAPLRRRNRGSGGSWTAFPVRAFFVPLVAPDRSVERFAGPPAPVVGHADATGHVCYHFAATVAIRAVLGHWPSPEVQLERLGAAFQA